MLFQQFLLTSIIFLVGTVGLYWGTQGEKNHFQQYESYCSDTDFACILREKDFIQSMGRTPATDAEIEGVYDIDDETLFSTEPAYHTTRLISATIECTDCTPLK